MTYRRALVFGPACLAAAMGISYAAPGADSPAASVRKQVLAVHGQVNELRRAWHRNLARVPVDKGKPRRILRISLEKAVEHRPLCFEVVQCGEDWIPGSAWLPGLHSSPHPFTVRNAGVTNAALRLELRVVLERGPGWGFGLVETMGELPNVPAIVDLRLDVAGGKIKGKYTLRPEPFPETKKDEEPPPNPLAATHGAVTGTVLAVDPPPEPWHAKAPPAWKAASIDHLAAAAQWLERIADRTYYGIRVFALMQKAGIPYDTAERDLVEINAARVFVPPRDAAGKKKGKKSTAPSLDDDDLGLGDLEEEDPAVKKEAAAQQRKKAEAAVAFAKSIHGRLGYMRRLVDVYMTADAAPSYQVDSIEVPDPEFGPWYDEEALPYDAKSGKHKLPADAGRAGPQTWPCVGTWELIGPFPTPRWDRHLPLLPDTALDRTSDYLIDRDALRRGKSLRRKDAGKWIITERSMPFGYIGPPNWSTSNGFSTGRPTGRKWGFGHTGLSYSSLYACTGIEAPCAMTLWAMIGVEQRGALWINDRLVWTGPGKIIDKHALETRHLVKLKFDKGLNRLVFRCDVHFSSPCFWLRICTRGAPRDAATVAARAAEVAKARKALPGTETFGFRGDGSGNFPKARPPVAWDYKRGKNLIWRTHLPYWSNSSPVITRDRVFLTVDPHWLYCLSKADGRILWRRPVTILETLPEEEKKEGWALFNAWWKARCARDNVPSNVLRPHKWLRNANDWYWAEGKGVWKSQMKDEREDASPELLALLDERDELNRVPMTGSVFEQLQKVNKQIEEYRLKEGGSEEQKSAQEAEKKLSKAWMEFLKFMRPPRSHVKKLGGYWYDYDGYAFATPVTDGKHVWCKTGMDAIACYDLEGNRRWIKAIDGGGSGSGTVPSPVLVEGKLVYRSPYRAEKGKKRLKASVYTALDPATGEAIWEAKPLIKAGYDWGAGTPAVMKLTNGKEAMTILIDAGSSVVRADDGKILRGNIGSFIHHGGPLVVDDRVFFHRPHPAMYRMIMVDRDRVGAKLLWGFHIGSHGLGYHSSVVSRKARLLYHETGLENSRYRWPWQSAGGTGERRKWVICRDFDTGVEVAHPEASRKACHFWSLSSVAADHVYMVFGDHIFAIGNKPPMWAAVLTNDRDPLVLARNVIERTFGGPVFEGERMYIRGYRSAACVGYTGDDGRRYEARITAKTLLDEIAAEPPPCGPDTIRPKQRFDEVAKSLNCRVEHNRAPHIWTYWGDFPVDAREKVVKAMGGYGARHKVGDTVKVAGVERKLWVLSTKGFPSTNAPPWEVDPANYSLLNEQRRIIPLDRVLIDKVPCVAYLYTELTCEKARTMSFEQKTPGVRVWIGGVPVNDGDRIAFPGEGAYPMVVEVKAERIPEGGLHISPRFFRSENPKEELVQWRAYVKRIRPYLDRVVKLAPAGVEAARARAVLSDGD